MQTNAIVLEAPERLVLSRLELEPPGEADAVVDIEYSGISTGTEKLLWSGEMPVFPGMGYPLVPGYESLGRIVDAGAEAWGRIGDWVFVPGAACYPEARALFGPRVRVTYGKSENVNPITVLDPEATEACFAAGGGEGACLGWPAPGVQLRINAQDEIELRSRHMYIGHVDEGGFVFLFTDGLVERRPGPDDGDIEFVDENLTKAMKVLSASDDPELACIRVLSEVVGDYASEDDIAVLVARREPNGEAQ